MSERSALSSIFQGEPPERVLLSRTPLTRVLCQISFEPVLSIRSQERVASLQDALRSDYPRLRTEQGSVLSLLPARTSLQDILIWRFSSPAHSYRISLATNFLTVETTRYESRDEFLSRLTAAVEVLAESNVAPSVVTRIGARYIDRVQGEDDIRHVAQLVRAEMRGMLSLMSEDDAELLEAWQEALVRHANTKVRARTGYLPARVTSDPTVLPPSDEPSWVLDVDAFVEDDQRFEPEGIVETVSSLADKCYRLFRWTVTPGFLRFFGGEI